MLLFLQTDGRWGNQDVCHPHARHLFRASNFTHQQRLLRGGCCHQHYTSGGAHEGVCQNTGTKKIEENFFSVWNIFLF